MISDLYVVQSNAVAAFLGMLSDCQAYWAIGRLIIEVPTSAIRTGLNFTNTFPLHAFLKFFLCVSLVVGMHSAVMTSLPIYKLHSRTYV